MNEIRFLEKSRNRWVGLDVFGIISRHFDVNVLFNECVWQQQIIQYEENRAYARETSSYIMELDNLLYFQMR